VESKQPVQNPAEPAAPPKDPEALISKEISSIRSQTREAEKAAIPDPEVLRREREAEAQYRERQKRWEGRERQKQKDADREKEREAERVKTMERNRLRLISQLEDPRANKEDEYYIDRCVSPALPDIIFRTRIHLLCFPL